VNRASALKLALYRRAMGVEANRLAGSERNLVTAVSVWDLIYYLYRKGFWPLVRGALYRPMLKESKGRFFLGRQTNILFPNRLSVGRNVAIGDYVFMNCFGLNGVRLGDNVRIREFGHLQVTSQLSNPGAGLEIGSNTFIGPHSVIGAGGGIQIGANVTLGAYVHVLAENHAFDDLQRPINQQGVTRRGIVIEADCWIGNAVVILDGVRIGRGAIIGAAAVVTASLPENCVAVGNPARVIRTRAEVRASDG
jgi:acetyltransferase-like isoleucine patch superfamily enzyme